MTASGLVAYAALDTHQPSPDAAWCRAGDFAGFAAPGRYPAAGISPAIRAISCQDIGIPLAGAPSGRPNLLRAHFAGRSMGGADYRIISRSGGTDAFGASLVADLRRVHGRYPDDRGSRRWSTN
jgi:hypothetical protein